MGSKNKLKRFKENATFGNVFQPTREEVVSGEFPLKGKWNASFFKNDNPLVLELGCGKENIPLDWQKNIRIKILSGLI
ncbi:hypothetical protein D9M69_635150 [compost metagenome]